MLYKIRCEHIHTKHYKWIKLEPGLCQEHTPSLEVLPQVWNNAIRIMHCDYNGLMKMHLLYYLEFLHIFHTPNLQMSQLIYCLLTWSVLSVIGLCTAVETCHGRRYPSMHPHPPPHTHSLTNLW